MMKIRSDYFDVIFYKDYDAKGGFPELIRKTFKVKHNSLTPFLKSVKNTRCLLVGSSSLRTFFNCIILFLKGAKVTIAPLGQLHEFLDNDNPFEFKDKFSEKGWELNNSKTRRQNGSKNIKTQVRFILRKIWKLIFIRIMIYLSDSFLVLSDYEKQMVFKISSKTKIITLEDWYYEPYKKIGKFLNLETNKINLIYWGRIDYYYKGLDFLVNVIGEFPNLNLYLSGGDYRGGLNKIEEVISKKQVSNIIIEKDIVSFENLKKFDFMILPSRWEGFYRAPMDAKYYNLNVITRDACNFDLYKTEKDIIFSSDDELYDILKKINDLK